MIITCNQAEQLLEATEKALKEKKYYEFTKIINDIKSKFKDAINSEEYIGFSSFSLVKYVPD